MYRNSCPPTASRLGERLRSVFPKPRAGWGSWGIAFLLVAGLFPASAPAQSPPEFELPITITDGEYTTTLTVGMREGASTGRDEYDRAAPPPPPSGAFDARLVGGSTDYFTDIRPPTEDTVDFEVVYQASSEGGPIELSWPSDRLVDKGTFTIVDRFGTGGVAIDMTETDRLDTATKSILEEGLIIRATVRSTPLPVELSAFTGRQLEDGAVRLRWQTQSETNNAGFAIEQRRDQGPFREVGFVPGAGTTSEPRDYRYRVDDMVPGSYAFRLRQVDHDGTAAYSETVPVQVHVDDGVWVRGPSPNPVRERARLEVAVESSQRVVVEAFDLLGRRVHHVARALPPHRAVSVDLDIGRLQLSSGVYFVHVRGKTFVETRRMTVLR